MSTARKFPASATASTQASTTTRILLIVSDSDGLECRCSAETERVAARRASDAWVSHGYGALPPHVFCGEQPSACTSDVYGVTGFIPSTSYQSPNESCVDSQPPLSRWQPRSSLFWTLGRWLYLQVYDRTVPSHAVPPSVQVRRIVWSTVLRSAATFGEPAFCQVAAAKKILQGSPIEWLRRFRVALPPPPLPAGPASRDTAPDWPAGPAGRSPGRALAGR